MNDEAHITLEFYGTSWCSDCIRSKRYLDKHQIPYNYVDVDADREGLELVRRLNRGLSVVPTIIFPDGSHLAEPSDEELAAKLAEFA